MANRPQSQPWETLIDENLKKVFEEDANADLPPQLMDLLDRLDKIPAQMGAPEAGSAPQQSQEEAE